MLKESFVRLTLICASVAIACAFVETVLRFTEYQYVLIGKGYGYPRDYFTADEELGFRIDENYPAQKHEFSGPSYDVYSNEFGCFDGPVNGPVSGIAIGDSYTWGFTPLEQKWTTRVERDIRQRILKCGVSGTGTNYQRQWLARLIERGLKPKFVIVLYHHNDWNDDFVFPDNTVVDGFRISNIRSISLETGVITRRNNELIQRKYAKRKEHGFVPQASRWHHNRTTVRRYRVAIGWATPDRARERTESQSATADSENCLW